MKGREEKILLLLAIILFGRMIFGDDVMIESAMLICTTCIISAIKGKA